MLRITFILSVFFIFSCGNAQKVEVATTDDSTKILTTDSVKISNNGDYIKR
ncbi:MAG: hypothetical protein IPH89_01135 [Bacteroidetes bacterium]|nr:hypothetical protein [Bacteroidota bacterium]